MFLNFQHFDGHCIMAAVDHPGVRDVEIFPINAQTFPSLIINGELRFQDTMPKLVGSLDNLIEIAKKNGHEFDITTRLLKGGIPFATDAMIDLVLGKQTFPFSYITDYCVLWERQLPAEKYFYNDIKDSPISD